MKNVIKPLAKSVLISLGLTPAASGRVGEGLIRAGYGFLQLKPINFNAPSSFNSFWNTKVLSKWT